MNVKDYERLHDTVSALMTMVLTHLGSLMSDAGHGTDTARQAIEATFSRSDGIDFDDWEMADTLALQLIREATTDVLDRLEELLEQQPSN